MPTFTKRQMLIYTMTNAISRHLNRVSTPYEEYEPYWFEPRRLYCVVLMWLVLGLVLLNNK